MKGNEIVLAIIDNDIAKLKSFEARKLSETNYSVKDYFKSPGNTSNSIIPLDNLSLVHIAALFDSLEAFMFLTILKKIPMETRSAAQYTPLHYACFGGATEVVAFILDNPNGKNLIKQDTGVEYTLLYLCVLSQSDRILRLLFENGATLTFNEQKLFGQAIKQKNVDIIKILLENHPNSRKVENRDFNPLMLAIISGQVDAIPLLYHTCPDITVPVDDKTALSVACFLDNPAAVKLLVSHYNSIDVKPDHKGLAAVHWICQSRNPEIASLVLSKGINVNRVDKDGHMGPFYMLDATKEDDVIKIYEMLLQNGMDINKRENSTLNSILGDVICSIKKSPKIIDFLLSHGADPYAVLAKSNNIQSQKPIAKVLKDTYSRDPRFRDIIERFIKE